MMDRRAFITGLTSAAVLAPVAAHAQTPPKTRRVGVLMTTTPVAAAHIVAVFADSLKELGHVDGQERRHRVPLGRGPPRAPRRDGRRPRAAQGGRDRRLLPGARARGQAGDDDDPDRHGQRHRSRARRGSSPAWPGPGATSPASASSSPPRSAPSSSSSSRRPLPRLARVAVLRSPATTVGLREYEAAGQALGMQIQFRRGEEPRRPRTRVHGDGPGSRRRPAGAG